MTKCSKVGFEARRHHLSCHLLHSAHSRVTPVSRKSVLSTQMSMLLFTHKAMKTSMNSSTTQFRIVRKQDGWRATLGEMSRASLGSFSAPIGGRIHRVSATA